MERPGFSTAIPKRRYRYGDYSAVVLGDVESAGPAQYRYILAIVPEGQSDPILYITSEKNKRIDAAEGSHRMRLLSDSGVTDLDSSDRWAEEELFASQALRVVSSVLGLTAEEAHRLL